MILDESSVSEITDDTLFAELDDVMYRGTDNRPAWIGPYRPSTAIPGLKDKLTWAQAHYDFYLGFVRDYMQRRGAVLDIGCGAGQNTAMLGRYSKLAVGVDSDSKAIAFARKHHKDHALFVEGRFPDLAISRTFDYAFIIETIEHVAYDRQLELLEVAISVLKPDGLLFITTPAEETPAAPHVGVWSLKWTEKMLERFKNNVLRVGYLKNTAPAEPIQEQPSSHLALVIKK